MSSAFVLAGTTVTFAPMPARLRRMFFFTPKSISTT
jgi:hypothetical protein